MNIAIRWPKQAEQIEHVLAEEIGIMKLVQAWIEIHQEDLMADWELATTGETIFKIDPLK